MSEPWVSMKDVQTHLGIGRDTVLAWINTRGLPGYKIGRAWKFKLSEVDEWLRANADKTAGTIEEGTDHA